MSRRSDCIIILAEPRRSAALLHLKTLRTGQDYTVHIKRFSVRVCYRILGVPLHGSQ